MNDKPKILLVDDEPDLVELVSSRLESAGYLVASAPDGQQALEEARSFQPDLIILDLMLPKLDGYKVCRLLKFDARYRAIPILIFTARAKGEDIQLASDCGADDYLTKPFEPKVLLIKVKELLAKGASLKG